MFKRKALDFVVVMIIFSCAGLSTVYFSDYVLGMLQVKRWTPEYFMLIPVVIMPSHNILLLFYSFLFGKFNYFWEREKKLFRTIFRRNKEKK
jgi:hypothetical protein